MGADRAGLDRALSRVTVPVARYRRIREGEALAEHLVEVAAAGEYEIDWEEHEHALASGAQGGLLKASRGFADQRVQRHRLAR